LLVLGREQAFDLVVSGINRGANVGDVSHLSGTVGAAMEALYLGVPAIAISQEREGVNTEASAKFAAQLVARYQRQGAPVGVMVSVNIPAGELKGVAVRPMGDSYLQTGAYELVEESGNRQTYESERIRVLSSDESTDTYAFQQGYITLTPLKFDWTAHEYIDEVKSWDLQLID
jgi:5'-nucleotidase